jgi:hypothetical protein
MSNANSLQRAVDLIMAFGERGIPVKLKADGSVPATLNPTAQGWNEIYLVAYLEAEVRLSNFQDAMKRKGHGSIYLTTEHAETVMHIRVLPGPIIFHYVD